MKKALLPFIVNTYLIFGVLLQINKGFLEKKFQVPSALEMLRSFRTIRQDWKLKDSIEKAAYLYGVGDLGYGTVGYPLFRDGQAIHWRASIYCMQYATHIFLVLYTIAFYLRHGQFAKCLPCTCLTTGPFLVVSTSNQI